MSATRHRATCTRVFHRYDLECARCQELAAGAAPRRGYGPSRAERDRQHATDVREHFASAHHKSGGCGPVCTFGEW